MAKLGNTKFADDTYLKLVIEHEEKVAELYKTFQEKHSEHWDFWGKLVAEEIGHANMLRRAQDKIADGVVELSERKMALRDIKTSLAFLEKEIHRANVSEKMRAEEAFVMALRVESTIVERRFFESFKSDLPAVMEAFDRIREQSEEHYLRIEKMAKNPPIRPMWLRTLFGTIRRKPKGESEADSKAESDE